MPSTFSEFDATALARLGAEHTVPEILGQPGLWEAVHAALAARGPELSAFLRACLATPDREVILTGAGSSAFIGELLEGPLAVKLGRTVRAVPTTDLVTHAPERLAPGNPALLVSFARSGNSPESVAALEQAEATLADVRHLVITCNPGGDLARHPTRDPKAVLVLPPAADDRGLAMTGSFTGMALAGLLLGDLEDLGAASGRVAALARAGRALLAQGDLFRGVSALDFRRAVFLGSGPLKSAARECHLKLQELTDGRVMCGYDSFLGFRHGPKAVLDPATLIVYLFSASDAVRRYETDLAAEVGAGERGLFRLALGAGAPPGGAEGTLPVPEDLDDPCRAILAALTGQVLGVYRSLALGLKPDAPSPSGTISRVVRGVTIYPTF